MTRHEAETLMLQHLAAMVEIAKQYDPETDYISAWAFAKTNAGMVTNNKSGKKTLDLWTNKLNEVGK